ncbi:hypothetical protein [Bradyrhizobium yuanmingense]|uniref:hypothetical protein n=1 Tax=Bradyrhizobium yuanmingense TaxID=108015 RepID=UPI0023B8CD39|nr:hypothetical protein [Bradyrhizobium yuanmingense]MDF0584724.1 hypothetical protein [Bradyrhizobium yuanmingense]
MVLILSGFLEEVLLKAILAFMVEGTDRKAIAEGPGTPLGSFSARVMIARSLGLITDDDAKDLGLIRAIRNDFAHQPGASFARGPIESRCREFAHVTDEVTDTKQRYRVACVGRERRQTLDPKYGLV